MLEVKIAKSLTPKGIERLKKTFGKGIDIPWRIAYIGKCAVKRAVQAKRQKPNSERDLNLDKSRV
ncbi:hypothetical protein C7H19_17305 [Aphanothece hegewaldii CCALA 016]|uniref:Uncharacterized protein n=2 Tax=Aphanothece TaxID=1121 RepID=A0A2T1LUC3_9CHRO|nr:hypothetical protein C7H19_17305 [Aphanothece hegewaldii CCALA 016]